MVGILKVRCHDVEVGFTCPQCRRDYHLEDHAIKDLFADFVPSHSKVLEACCGKRFALSHTSYSLGCYACDKSDIHIHEL